MHNEKLKRSQRLALQKDGGTLHDTLVTSKKMTLKVLQYGSSEVNDVELEGEVLADNLEKQYGYISEEDARQLNLLEDVKAGRVYVYVRTYPQVHQKIRIHKSVPKGVLVLTEMQRHNLEVTRQDSFEFTFVYNTDSIDLLSEVNIDVRPRYMDENDKKDWGRQVLNILGHKVPVWIDSNKERKILDR